MWQYVLARGLVCGITLFQMTAVLAVQVSHRVGAVSEAAKTSKDNLEQASPSNGSRAANSIGALISGPDSENVDTELLNTVRHVLDQHYLRPPNSRDDSPWKLLHWSIAYGIDAQTRVGGPGGKQVSAIGWLCENRPSAGLRLMSESRDGMQLPIAPGKQGHPGQFLAMLAQSQVQPDFGIRVGNRGLTVGDLVAHEKDTCRTGQELTFKLIGISHYGSSEDEWKNNRGEPWSLRRLLDEELKQPISARSTCGGTHRLFALSYAVHCRRKEGLPIDGPWGNAARRMTEYQARAFRMQNRDGSFSTAWLDRSGSSLSADRRLTTSGHVAEWLAFTLTEDGLHDERFERGLKYLTGLLETHRPSSSTWGATSHALHALAIYEQRMSGATPGQRRQGWMDVKTVTTEEVGKQDGKVL